jgi:hypothetical protein
LASLGGQFDALFDQLGRIETAIAVETHGAAVACLPVSPSRVILARKNAPVAV